MRFLSLIAGAMMLAGTAQAADIKDPENTLLLQLKDGTVVIQLKPEVAPNHVKRIKELAFQHNVPVIENIPLARALFAATKVGTMIPVEMYVAIAEVLAFVMRQRERFGSKWRGSVAA